MKEKTMKTKLTLIAVLAVAMAGSAGWLTPRLLSAPTNAVATDHKILYYTCPMHPSVKSDKPDDCPECGMKLQPVHADSSKTNAPAAAPMGCCSMGGCGR